MSSRILHVAQPVDAGVPRVVCDLAEDQARRGWDVVVACPPGGHLWDTIDRSSCRVVGWSASRSPGPVTALETVRLAGIIRRERPDLVHLHSAKAGLAGRLAVRGAKATVFQPHAWSFEAVSGASRRAAGAWERFAARWTDALVCVSHGEAEVGRAVGIDGAYEIVPNGVDLIAWPAPGPEERAVARTELGIDRDAPVVVCVGRLSRQKGQDVLLSAWASVTARHPDARLFLIGDGPDKDRLAAGAPAGVELVGQRSDVRAWYLAADCVAMPSRWEGMSIAMLEAMACARCVIATAVPGATEVLRDGAGYVVPVEDAAALGDRLVQMIGSPDAATAAGEEARRRLETDHDITRVRERVTAIYRKVLERRRAYR